MIIVLCQLSLIHTHAHFGKTLNILTAKSSTSAVLYTPSSCHTGWRRQLLAFSFQRHFCLMLKSMHFPIDVLVDVSE